MPTGIDADDCEWSRRPTRGGPALRESHREAAGGSRGWPRAKCPPGPPGAIRYNPRMQLRRGNLYLVGLMGAGKTTLGRLLARRLGKRYVDADHELEGRLGVTIPTIFEIEGEAAFRDREEAVIADLVALECIVLGTGGGAVLREANRRRLAAGGTVVYLHAEPATLYERVRHSRHRPLLKAADPAARIAELYAQRDPLYREVADLVIASDRDEVMRAAREWGPSHDAGAESATTPQQDPR
jgi:shikimate kinase